MADFYQVREVLNYGGFFAGDTVTLTAAPFKGGDDRDFTIDEHALTNVSDRHKIVAGLLLELDTTGDKVERATVVGALSREVLRAAIDEARERENPAHPTYRVFGYKCPRCDVWVRGEPEPAEGGGYICRVCQEHFEA